MPSLGKSESARIHDAISPGKTSILKSIDEVAHCFAAIELEHERHVLDEQPPRLLLARIKKPEHVLNEAGLLAMNTGSSSGLAQILAGEARGENVDIRQSL